MNSLSLFTLTTMALLGVGRPLSTCSNNLSDLLKQPAYMNESCITIEQYTDSRLCNTDDFENASNLLSNELGLNILTDKKTSESLNKNSNNNIIINSGKSTDTNDSNDYNSSKSIDTNDNNDCNSSKSIDTNDNNKANDENNNNIPADNHIISDYNNITDKTTEETNGFESDDTVEAENQCQTIESFKFDDILSAIKIPDDICNKQFERMNGSLLMSLLSNYYSKNCPQDVIIPTPTKAPQATTTPTPTKAPQATTAPTPTKAPQATTAPTPTKAPQATTAPTPTKAPQATSTPSPTPTNAPSQTELSYAEQVVELVNEERAKAGLSPLTINTNAATAALTRAKEIVTSFSHTRPSGKNFSTALTEAGVSFRGSGENIAYGQKTPKEVMNGWMNSPGHRANILNAKFKSIGIGVYESGNRLYWVQLFIY